ncbi:rCG37369 [Rattus norvegicus]|nr:rCG37369 [Rattus norvegicus]
MCVRTRI